MGRTILFFLFFLVISCSYVRRVHITGFIIGFDPEAKYDVKYFNKKYEGEGFPDSIEIRKINKVGWFELSPDSSATSYLIQSDSAQFRKKMGDSTAVLSTIRPWINLYEQTIIDNNGVKYYVRYKGRGVSYLDNLQIGHRD